MSQFIWDISKEIENVLKHRVNFQTAKQAFLDPKRKIVFDAQHSREEERFFCIGKVNNKILTVRFTHRGEAIRIIGAGYWRKGKIYYEKD